MHMQRAYTDQQIPVVTFVHNFSQRTGNINTQSSIRAVNPKLARCVLDFAVDQIDLRMPKKIFATNTFAGVANTSWGLPIC